MEEEPQESNTSASKAMLDQMKNFVDKAMEEGDRVPEEMVEVAQKKRKDY